MQPVVDLFSFAAKVVCPFLWRFYDDSANGGKYLHWTVFTSRNEVTLLRSQRQLFLLWTDASAFRGSKDIPICNKICYSSEVKGCSIPEAALLSLDMAFSYRFSTRQRARETCFKEMTGVLQALARWRWIETFKRPHLHIFGDNFAVTTEATKELY